MAPRKGSVQRTTRTGAGATGASAGTLLVLLVRNLPESNPWKSWALILAPSLAVGLSWTVIWLRHIIEQYINKRNRATMFDSINERIREALQNPLTSEEHKRAMLKELEEVERLRIAAERDQLQVVLK